MIMNNLNHNLVVIMAFGFIVFLIGCQGGTEQERQTTQDTAEGTELATARVIARSAEPDQVLIQGHNEREYTVHAGQTTDGLNEIETLLAAQSTCAVFVAEKAAQELDVSLTGATALAVFKKSEQNVHVFLDVPGSNDEEVLELANHLRQRCPIYTTLAEANSVEFTPHEQFEPASEDGEVVIATLTEFGRANVSAQDFTFIMDSVPPLDGPNENLNPLDMMLGGLAACSRFVYEHEIPGSEGIITVEGDFDPSGVRDLAGENPRIQKIRIIGQLEVGDESLAEKVEEEIKEQCFLYKTLNSTVDMEFIFEPLN